MGIEACRLHACDKTSTYRRPHDFISTLTPSGRESRSSLSEHGVITGDHVSWHEASRAEKKFVMADDAQDQVFDRNGADTSTGEARSSAWTDSHEVRARC
jgi:hypothetical protein